MRHDFDWSRAPAPWNRLGPDIAESIRRTTIAPDEWWVQLRDARRRLGLRQQQVAHLIGAQDIDLSAVEVGEHRLQRHVVEAICELYGIPMVEGAVARK